MKQVVFGLYILLILLLGVVTFVEKKAGTEYVSFYIYGSWWFPVLWGVLAVGSFSWMCKRKLIRKPAVWLLHFSFLVILAGALLTFLTAERGVLHLRQGRMMNVFRNEQQGRVTLPVSVRRPISPNVLPSSSGFFRRNSSKSRTPERSSQGQNEPFLNSRGLRADFIVKVNDIFQHGIPDSVILH
jgi:hypothetical protein